MPRPAPNLDIGRVLDAAFAQLEADGLDGLSMRRLAGRLGVQAPALYWHVGDKAELLGLMKSSIYDRAYAGVAGASDWRDWLLKFGRALRAAYTHHRDGALLCAVAPALAKTHLADHARQITGPMVALGVEMRAALVVQSSVISFTLGWASFQSNGPMHDYLDEMLDFEDSFETGLQSLVLGFSEQLPCQARL